MHWTGSQLCTEMTIWWAYLSQTNRWLMSFAINMSSVMDMKRPVHDNVQILPPSHAPLIQMSLLVSLCRCLSHHIFILGE